MREYNVLNLGAGWQSTWCLLMACRGEIPKFDVAIFADTQWEPKAVYTHLDWLTGVATAAGIPVERVTAGDLRKDAIEFRQLRESSNGKRYASIPVFIKNLDGSQGRVKRQCTKEYKIEIIEKWIRRQLLALPPKARVPKGVIVRQWFGISDDEASRATFPGRFKFIKKEIGKDLYGDPVIVEGRKWMPVHWRHHVYPLLNEIWLPSRKIVDQKFIKRRMQRADVGEWLKANYPDRDVPRSACIGCPFRSNEEWRAMRDNAPDEFADACDFDDAQRIADANGQRAKRMFVGLPFVHRQLVPLRMADLGGVGGNGGGCGTLYDGQDGLCGV